MPAPAADGWADADGCAEAVAGLAEAVAGLAEAADEDGADDGLAAAGKAVAALPHAAVSRHAARTSAERGRFMRLPEGWTWADGA